jgi:hypothetical protein
MIILHHKTGKMTKNGENPFQKGLADEATLVANGVKVFKGLLKDGMKEARMVENATPFFKFLLTYSKRTDWVLEYRMSGCLACAAAVGRRGCLSLDDEVEQVPKCGWNVVAWG